MALNQTNLTSTQPMDLPPLPPTITSPQQQQQASSSTGDLVSQMTFELKKQKSKIDSYLELQNQTLMKMSEDTWQTDMLIQNFGSKLVGLINNKEEELAVARQNEIQLNAKMNAWQSIAFEKYAMALDLRQQLQEMNKIKSNGASDEGSSSSGDMVDYNCKMCHRERSCVIILPCKHLCSCQRCEFYVYLCPVCGSPKESCMEIRLARGSMFD